MYFPAFWSRWKLPRWSGQRVVDILEVDIFKVNVSEVDGLQTARSLLYEPSTSAASDGFVSPLLTPSSQSNNFDFHLELPTFSSLVDDLPQLLHPMQTEDAVRSPSLKSVGSIRDRRDELIGELLDHVTQLRQKLRCLGDDNSRLRQQLTDSPPPGSLTNSRKHLSDKLGTSVALSRPYPFRKYSASQEDERNSQEDCDSAYSYYHNPDYFPNTSSPTPSSPVPTTATRLRARTESILPVDGFLPSGFPQRRRYYSLPTPRQCREYAESRLKDGTKLELGPHLRRLISLRCPVSPEKPILNKTLIHGGPPVNNKSPPENSPPCWGLRKPGKGLVRRPQPRIQLSTLEPIFRCFACSQRFGQCAYADCVWIGDHYVNFGYFEMLYFHAAYGLWGPANLVTEYYNSSAESTQPLDDGALETENRPFVEDIEDEVDDLLSEEPPLSSIQLLEGTRRENVEPFVTNEHAVSDAQRRRERHIALLDSIIEEEELDDVPPDNVPFPVTTNIHHPKPVHAHQVAQTTLAAIPEQEIDTSESTTTSRCPPLTDDSFSSTRSNEQGSLATFDDFEDIDFVSTLKLSPRRSENLLGCVTHIVDVEVNTVAFPVTPPPSEKLTVRELPLGVALA